MVTQQGYDGLGNTVRISDGAGPYHPDELRRSRPARVPGRSEPGRRHAAYASDSPTTRPATRSSGPARSARRSRSSYDALNRLTKQVEPKTATTSITTSFGYDAAGNRTRYTDGRQNSTFYGVNSLGLPESVIEPATTAQAGPADRTWTVSYDLNGNATDLPAPGGSTRVRTLRRRRTG